MMLPVFLVEDDPTLRAQLTEFIDEVCEAHVVATAQTQREATLWRDSHPQEWKLAVVDLYLKEGTAFGVLESMPVAAQRAQVVVLTNSATPDNRARCLRLGARAVFDKTSELDAFLDHCRAQRALCSALQ